MLNTIKLTIFITVIVHHFIKGRDYLELKRTQFTSNFHAITILNR